MCRKLARKCECPMLLGVSLFLDFRFGPSTFEQIFNIWETTKIKCERPPGASLSDRVC